ncbi:MAG: succinate dehydrogenase cytochrome b subunit [Planctomycetes bacterium]|nr:succinate dehydrogenase cytochrome b subunit [Planctomycetota bacterium]
MASTQAGPRHPKGPPKADPTEEAGPFLSALLDSSVGSKILVALTGLGLVSFAVIHMIGNLKVFQGPDSINAYAYFLKHSLGVLIWIARGGLLGIFVLHLTLALRLQFRSRAARPVPYQYPGSVQATAASRTMMWSGIVVGLFILFHLAHFTFGWAMQVETAPGKWESYLELKDSQQRQDVYSMVVFGFTNPLLVALYTVAQLVLFVHLLHGIQSSFQTLGLKNRRFASLIKLLGFAVAFTILVGNLVIVFGVMAGYAPPLYKSA